MNDINSRSIPEPLVFVVFFFSIFMFFTPFEQGGTNASMFPKYLVAGVSLMLLVPLFVVAKISLKTSSVLVLLALGAILLHTMVVNPVPGQFVLLIFANVFLAVLIYEASFIWRKQFVSAVSWVLKAHALAISIQAFQYYAFNRIFDFHKFLFGSDSRFVEDYLNIARFSGMQVEPGTYANYIACLLAILLMAAPFRANVFWTAGIALISIFLTNSGSSIYFVPVLSVLLMYLGRDKIKPLHILSLAFVMLAYLYFSGILAHLQMRFVEQDDGSLSHRLSGVQAYLTTTWEDKFIGVGFGKDPCVRCFYQDIGVIFNLLTRGGAMVAIALAPLLFRAVAVNGITLSLLLLLIPLNEKMFFYEAPIWLFFLFATTALSQAAATRELRRTASAPAIASSAGVPSKGTP